MKPPKILVTSAAGHTGYPTVMFLLKRGFPVRAMVRSDDHRARKLRDAGAEIFVGDLFDYRDLSRALNGIQRAYYCPPFGLSLLNGAMLFAIAAEQSRLESVVLLSQWQPHEVHHSNVSREHWIANQIYRWMPTVDVIHLNPGIFAFTYLLSLPMARHFGFLPLPYGDAPAVPVANEDIGACAAALLADPRDHVGKTYRPTGPKLVVPADATAALSKTFGKKVHYRAVSSALFTKAAVAQGFPLSEIAHLRHYIADLHMGAYALGGPTDHIQNLTGAEPEPFDQTIARYARDPGLIHPLLHIGSWFEAFGLMMRMMATPAPDLDRWEARQSYPVIKNPVRSMEHDGWVAAASAERLFLLNPNPEAEERKSA